MTSHAPLAPRPGFDPVAKWVAVYVRISRDRNGRAENVETQIELGTGYARSRWPSARIVVYCDNDLSAADPDTYRPDYDRLLGDIRGGRVAQVVSADQDRLTRQPSEWEALMPVLLAAGILETHGYRDGITSVEPGKRSYGRFKALMGAEYVEGLKVKVNEKLAKLARDGRPSGATAFGYRHEERDGEKVLVVVEDEAHLVQWAAKEVLDGTPLNAIARELSAQGVRGAKGGALNSSSVKSMVTNYVVAGKRYHNGAVAPGTWPAILDEGTWLAVRAKLARNAEQRVRPGRRRNYLLSGIAVCECGQRMIGRRKSQGGREPRTLYVCKSCGCSIHAEEVEDHVAERLLERLDALVDLRTPDEEHAARRDEIVAELKAIENKRAAYGRMLADDEMDPTAYAAAKERLDHKESKLTDELADMPRQDVTIDPDAVRNAWQHNTIDEKRELIAMLVNAVRIDRSRPGAPRRLNLGRVHIEGSGWD